MRENEISVEIYDYGPLLSKEEIKGFGMKALNFLLAQTFSLKEKLYQKNNSFLSTGSFFRKKVLKKQKEKDFIIGGCDTIITEKHGAESELSAALR